MKIKLENFAKKYGLVFMYYKDYPTGYEDMSVHYKSYILNINNIDYTKFSIFNGEYSKYYLDLKSAFKAFEKIMGELK